MIGFPPEYKIHMFFCKRTLYKNSGTYFRNKYGQVGNSLKLKTSTKLKNKQTSIAIVQYLYRSKYMLPS
jgi:hypothetical protein